MFGVPGGATVWEKGAQSGAESRMSRLTTPRNGSDMTSPQTGGSRACTGLSGASWGPAGAASPRCDDPAEHLAIVEEPADARVERVPPGLPSVQGGQQLDAQPIQGEAPPAPSGECTHQHVEAAVTVLHRLDRLQLTDDGPAHAEDEADDAVAVHRGERA